MVFDDTKVRKNFQEFNLFITNDKYNEKHSTTEVYKSAI